MPLERETHFEIFVHLGCYAAVNNRCFGVSGKDIPPTVKGQAVMEEFFLDGLTLENGTDRLSRNVGK
jgi:hypothetical protein